MEEVSIEKIGMSQFFFTSFASINKLIKTRGKIILNLHIKKKKFFFRGELFYSWEVPFLYEKKIFSADILTLRHIKKIRNEPCYKRYPIGFVDHFVKYFEQLSTKLFYSRHENLFFHQFFFFFSLFSSFFHL